MAICKLSLPLTVLLAGAACVVPHADTAVDPCEGQPRPIVSPDQVDRCDGIDNDCDGLIDEDPDPNVTYYADADLDGFGTELISTACAVGDGWTTVAGDCDDSDPYVNPTRDDIGDHIDNDCDGTIDEDGCFYDGDKDGFGDPAHGGFCSDINWVSNDDDCEDRDADVYPYAQENDLRDAYDENCDGLTTTQGPWYVAGDWAANAAHHVWLGEEGDGLAAATTIWDTDFDQREELALGSPGYQHGAGLVVLLGRTDLGDMPDVELGRWEGSGSDHLGATLAAHDLDRDLRGDLAMGAPGADSGGEDAGAVVLVTGDDLDADPIWLHGTEDAAYAGTQVQALPSTGFDVGLIVSAPGTTQFGAPIGAVYLIRQAPSASGSLADAAGTELVGSVEHGGIQSAFPVGDLDGDGIPDLSATYGSIDTGAATLLFGELPARLDVTDEDRLPSETRPDALAGGDVNLDGWVDLAIAEPDARGGAGRVTILLGPHFDHADDLAYEWLGDPAEGLGSGVAIADVNANGIPEVITSTTLGGGSTTVFFHEDGSSVRMSYPGADHDALFRSVLIGDVNADGTPDIGGLAPGSELGGSGAGALFLFMGDTPSTML